MRVRDVLPKHMLDKIPLLKEGEYRKFRVIVDEIVTNRYDENGKPIPQIPPISTASQCTVKDPKSNQSYLVGYVTGSTPRQSIVDGREQMVMQPILESIDFGSTGEVVCGPFEQDKFDYLSVYATNRDNPFRDKSKMPKFYLEDAEEELKIKIQDQELEDDAITIVKTSSSQELLAIMEGLPAVEANALRHNTNPDVLRVNLRNLIRIGKYEMIIVASENKDFKRKVQIAEAESYNIIKRNTNKRHWEDAAGNVLIDVDVDKEWLSELNKYFGSQNGRDSYIWMLKELDAMKKK